MISYLYFSLSLFADEIILYIKDCKDSTTYHLYLINSFSKDSLLKIDTKVNSNPVYKERNQGNYCIHSRFPGFLSVCLSLYIWNIKRIYTIDIVKKLKWMYAGNKKCRCLWADNLYDVNVLEFPRRDLWKRLAGFWIYYWNRYWDSVKEHDV